MHINDLYVCVNLKIKWLHVSGIDVRQSSVKAMFPTIGCLIIH